MSKQKTDPDRLDLSDAGDELTELDPLTLKPPSVSSGSDQEEHEIEMELPQEAVDYIESLKQQLEEAIAARQRALADFRNYQRRSLENEQQALRTGKRNVIGSLLPVLDHFDLALNQDFEGTSIETLLNGVKIVRDEITKALQLHGVQIIEPSVGDEFDPNRHEAMLKQEAEGIEPNGIVMILQQGYAMGDVVLRPAKVAVAPGESDEE
ncbi:MAG: nucleotide exchange factor GrpE [Planctomycetota bacterium]|nr:nucleotide exchange factor GrpE [Planctomycetota bacterium]